MGISIPARKLHCPVLSILESFPRWRSGRCIGGSSTSTRADEPKALIAHVRLAGVTWSYLWSTTGRVPPGRLGSGTLPGGTTRRGGYRNVCFLADRQHLNADQIKTTASNISARMGNRYAASAKFLPHNQSAKNCPAKTGRATFTGRCQKRFRIWSSYTDLEWPQLGREPSGNKEMQPFWARMAQPGGERSGSFWAATGGSCRCQAAISA